MPDSAPAVAVLGWEDGWEKSFPARGVSFELHTRASGKHCFSVRSTSFQPCLLVLDADGTVLAELLGDYGVVEAPIAELEAGRCYRVVVASQFGLPGPFRLRVSVGQPEDDSPELDAEHLRGFLEDGLARLREKGGAAKALALMEYRCGALAEEQGRWTEAREHLEHALELCESSLGEHPLTDEVRIWLGYVLGHFEMYAAATELARDVVRHRESELDADHPSLGLALVNLGASLAGQGLYRESIEPLRLGTGILETHPQEEPETLATALVNLGINLTMIQGFTEARQVLERGLELCEELYGPDQLPTVSPLKALALVATEQGDFAWGCTLLDRAIATAEQQPAGQDLLMELLSQRAGALVRLEQFAQARSDAERSLEMSARRGVEHSLDANNYLLLGGIARQQDRYEDAEGALLRAIEIGERTLGPEHLFVGGYYAQYGELLIQLGDFTRAEFRLRRAVDLYRRALGPDHAWVAITEQNLGQALEELGQLEEARRLRERCVETLTDILGPNHLQTLVASFNLGALLANLGLHAQAEALLRPTHTTLQATLGPGHGATRSAANNLAVVLGHLGETDAALELLRKAAEHSPTEIERAEKLHNLAAFLDSAGDREGAISTLVDVLVIRKRALGEDHLATAATRHMLALHRLAAGELDDAERLSRAALAVRERRLGNDHPEVADSLRVLALALLAQDRREEAWKAAGRAFEIGLERLSASTAFLSEGERFAFANDLRNHMDTVLAVAEGSGSRELEERAYAAVLDWKGRISRELVATKERALGSLDEDARELVARLQSTQARLATELVRVEIRDPQLHAERLSRLRGERSALEREIAGRLPAAPTARVELASLQRALPPDAALVDFLVHRSMRPGGENETVVSAWVFRAAADGPVRVPLGGRTDLVEATRRFLAILITDGSVGTRGDPVPEGNGTPAWEEAGASLRRVLWEPLAAAVDDANHLIVSPDDFLWTLPLEALPLEDGSFLIEQRAVSYLQDAVTLLDAGAAPRRRGSGLLAVGAVDYAARVAANPATQYGVPFLQSEPGPDEGRGGRQRDWKPLRFTEREVDQLKGLFRASHPEASAQLLTGREATKEAIAAALPGRAYVHLATHGFFQPAGQTSIWDRAREEHISTSEALGERSIVAGVLPGLLSGLACSGADYSAVGELDANLLTAEEVTWLDLSGCEMVVLSACDSALGEARAGEGLASLRRAFRLAGARSVIGSVWSVDDESTAELMVSMYRRLWRDGASKLDALRGAQLELLARNRAEGAGRPLPRTWAAFVLDGDWR